MASLHRNGKGGHLPGGATDPAACGAHPARDGRERGLVGRRYLLRGVPVTVVARWATPARLLDGDDVVLWLTPPTHAPRNVLLEFGDGTRTVRPFRGLRKNYTEES